MEYYFFKKSSNLTVVGKYPQSEKMCGEDIGQYDYSLPGSIRWLPTEGELLVNPKVECWELKYRAKATDIISALQISSPAALLVSERFYEFLRQFRCLPMKDVACKIVQMGKTHVYRFLYFPLFQNHFIDFRDSRFMLSTPIDGTYDYLYERITFNDYEDYLRKIQQLEQRRLQSKNLQQFHYIQVTDLFINEQIANLDLFRLLRLNNNFIVSNALKSAIEQNRFTGMEFIPAQGAKIIDLTTMPPRQIIY